MSQQVFQCYHCGNETLMNLVGEHRENWENEDSYGYTVSCMFICPICQETTYVERYWELGMVAYNGEDIVDEKIYYPAISLDKSYIPENIKTAFEGALKSRNTDRELCLLGLRRTLERICKEQGATENNLEKKVTELANRNILPPTLKEASDITRHFGNSAAHGDEMDISKNELNLIVEFVELLINYIYVIPQKILRLKKLTSDV